MSFLRPQFPLLKSIYQTHKWRLGITYSLFTLEMAGALLRPFFVGKAIDGLVYGNNLGLYQLIAIHLIWVVIGMIRQRFDTRTYSSIYSDLVTKMLIKRKSGYEVSKLSAHSTLVRELVDFLEFDLVYVAEAGFNIVGSLFLLFFYDIKIVGICLAILIPVSIISFFYGKKMKNLTTGKNDELEKQVDIIATQNPLLIKRHYHKLRIWQIKISDQESINFGVMEIMVIIVLALSLYITSWITHTEEINGGSLASIYLYILRFTSGLDTIPYAVQKLSNLGDITQRIALAENEETIGLAQAE